jgi:hypothetical protein
MTTRERLHRLVDDLSEDQAAEALALLESQIAQEAEPPALPEFFGMLRSGKGDLAARSDEILRAEFGVDHR